MSQEKNPTEDTQEYFIEVEYRTGKFSEKKSYQGNLWYQNFNSKDEFITATQELIPAVAAALATKMIEIGEAGKSKGNAPKQ